MLHVIVPSTELYNDATAEFTDVPGFWVDLEHSLVSLSKWESIHEKRFLENEARSREEVLSYIECMLLAGNPPENWVEMLRAKELDAIDTYIQSTQTATTFGDLPERTGRGELITSELIYYWMVLFTIPMQCETWHLNRLFTLIKICNLKQQKPKKISPNELAQRNRDLNAKRQAALGTTG